MRHLRLLLVAVLVVGAAIGSELAPAAAEPLPSGFTDGVPVGAPPDPGTPPEPTTKADPSPSGLRYFGDGPWAALKAAASSVPRCAGLSAPGLVALMVSPVFKESSAATVPSTAPSPMTLSRYDEWNGTRNDETNRNANYGLYAFRDPRTGWQRAYWHPGIGIWQYDSAGVGAPFTAIERMDVRIVGVDVATGMARRYCNPQAAMGHAAPFTAQERRDAAWAPWWGTSPKSCPKCQAEFAQMTARAPYFGNIRLVKGITSTGGAAKRVCSLPGPGGTREWVTCWYVNPVPGVIQGATGWATVAPDGKLDPTVSPAPLARPFYVVKRNGTEERYWLRADTGYSIDIVAARTLGKNARPRTSQTGSGLRWSKVAPLCDHTTRRGACPRR